MRQFILENRLTTDDCAIVSRELQNESMVDYSLYNMYPTSSCKEDECMTNFMADNPNLRYRDGYGNANGCFVDNDSELRNNAKMTNFREKEQLCTRWYKAVPDYGKGGIIPNVESRLKYSEDTTKWRRCDIVPEKDFQRFIPMLGCVQPVQYAEHVIQPNVVRGGQMTRDFVRDDDYLKSCGFQNDGKTWRRK